MAPTIEILEELFSSDGSTTDGFTIAGTGSQFLSSNGKLLLGFNSTAGSAGATASTNDLHDFSADQLITFDWTCLRGVDWYDDDQTDADHVLYQTPNTITYDSGTWGYSRPSGTTIIKLRSIKSNIVHVGSSTYSFMYSDGATYSIKVFIENTTGTVYLWIDDVFIGDGSFTPQVAGTGRYAFHWHSYTNVNNYQIYDDIVISTATEYVASSVFDPSIASNKTILSLDSSEISEDQTDFPLTIQLDSTDPIHAAILTELASPIMEWDPLNIDAAYTITNSHLITKSGTSWSACFGKEALPTTGKWLIEFKQLNDWDSYVGLGPSDCYYATQQDPDGKYPYRMAYNGAAYDAGGSLVGTYTSWTTNDVIGIAVDMDAGTIHFYKNGVVMNSGNPIFSNIIFDDLVWYAAVYNNTQQCRIFDDTIGLNTVNYPVDGYTPAALSKRNTKKFSIEQGTTQLPVEIEAWSEYAEQFSYPPAFTATYTKATTADTSNYEAYRATDPTQPLTGTWGSLSTSTWLSIGSIDPQKFNIDLGEAKLINAFNFANCHNSGASTDRGIKNFLLYGTNSATAFANVTYATLTDLTLLGTYQAAEHVASDVPDIQTFDIADNTTEYRYYILRIADNWGSTSNMGIRHIAFLYSSPGKATLHTKVPTYSASANTELTLSYDSTQVDNTYVGDTGDTIAQSVWDANFVFVSHQAQDPSGTAPQILDSTSYAKHGTSYGTMTSADLIDGATGKMIDYDGTDDYTNHGYDAAHNITTTLTLEALIQPSVLIDSSFSNTVGIVSRRNNPTNSEDTFNFAILAPNGTLVLGTSGGNIQSTKTSWAADTAFLVTATYNSTGLVGELFVDGVKETLTNDTVDAMIGSTNNLVIATDTDTGNFFPGAIDEVRISNIVRSDDWIKLTNLSLTDQLITASAYVAPTIWDETKKVIISNILPTSADDDFTGTDGDAPNSLLWELFHDSLDSGSSSGTATIQSNTLELGIPNDITLPVIESTFKVSSDFDIQVDFSIPTNIESSEAWAFGLNIDVASGDLFSGSHAMSSRFSTTLGPYRQNTYNVSASSGGSADQSGKFRIVRSGSSVTPYYWTGSAWTSLCGVDASFGTSDVYVQLWSRKWDSAGTTSVRFDNFTVNSGTIVWPELTDFQLPLLLLESYKGSVDDDFTGDDGDPPNPASWELISSGTGCTQLINNNKLRATIPVTSEDLFISTSSKFKLSGDFDIEIDWDIISQTNPSSSAQYLGRFGLYSEITGNSWCVATGANSTSTVGVVFDTLGTWVDYDLSLTSGKFRITRVGNALRVYVWDNSRWEWNGSTSGYLFTNGTSTDVNITLYNHGDFDGGGVLDWDNFTVNSGTIVWPAGTNGSGVTDYDMAELFDDLGSSSKKIALTIGDTDVEVPIGIVPADWDASSETATIYPTFPTLSAGDEFTLYWDSTQDDNTNVTDLGATPADPTDPYELAVWGIAEDDELWSFSSGIDDSVPTVYIEKVAHLMDGNFDLGVLATHWNSGSGTTLIRLDKPDAYSASYHWASYQTGSDYQRIDLLAAGLTVAELDSGYSTVSTSWKQASRDGYAGTSEVQLKFLNSSLAIISTTAAGLKQSPEAYETRSLTDIEVPVGARYIDYTLNGDLSSGTYAFNAIDDCEDLTFTVPFVAADIEVEPLPAQLTITGIEGEISGEVSAYQVVAEVLYGDVGEANVPQVIAEVLYSDIGVANVPQVVVEVMYNPNSVNLVGNAKTDFSTFVADDWEDIYSTGSISASAEDNSAITLPLGNQLLEVTSISGTDDFVVWDGISLVSQAEMLLSLRNDYSNNGVVIATRISGYVGHENYYFARITSSLIELGKVVDGTETVFDSVAFSPNSEDCWIRISNTAESLKFKVWGKATFEPNEWTIESTNTEDDELLYGAIGFGIDGVGTAEIDYLEVEAHDDIASAVDECVYPPAGHIPTTLGAALIPTTESVTVAGSWAHVFSTGNTRKYIDAVNIYCTEYSDDIRVGVYIGGSSTNPENAVLLSDLGKTSDNRIDGWITLDTDPGLIPENSTVWVIFKGDNPDGFYIPRTPSPANAGNVISDEGVFTISTQIFPDPDEVFPRSIITGIPVAGVNYYKIELVLSDAPQRPRRPALVFVVES